LFLFTASSGSISDLDLHGGDLYFIEERRAAILKLKTSDADFLQRTTPLLLPTVLKRFPTTGVSGFVIGPAPSR